MTNSQIKIDLAYAYRILAHLKMDDHTYTHLSARNINHDQYYIFPFGLCFEEVTPEILLTMNVSRYDNDADIYQLNQTAYAIHGSIYENRPDVNVVFHLHTHASVAVSAMTRGLLPISQWALHFYDQISYYDYDSLVIDEKSQGGQLTDALGKNNILFLRNHGFIVCAKHIQEALFYCYHLEQACKTQILALSTGEELIMPSKEICKKTNHDLLSFENKLGDRDFKAWVRIIKNKYQLEF